MSQVNIKVEDDGRVVAIDEGSHHTMQCRLDRVSLRSPEDKHRITTDPDLTLVPIGGVEQARHGYSEKWSQRQVDVETALTPNILTALREDGFTVLAPPLSEESEEEGPWFR